MCYFIGLRSARSTDPRQEKGPVTQFPALPRAGEDCGKERTAEQGRERMEPWKMILSEIAARDEYRSLTRIAVAGDSVAACGEVMDLSSNDYLCLSRDQRLVEAAIAAARRFGVGSTGSRLMSGNLDIHRKLEEAIAQWKGTEAALLMGSGYLANLGVISALSTAMDQVFLDRLCHASIVDGVRLGGRRFRRFRHNDPGHLEELLQGAKDPSRVLVVVEGVYSMDGDVVPLNELLALRARFGFILLLDDAHGIGVMGREGRGVVAVNRACEVDVHIGTFGKALGCYGAFIACSSSLREFLVNVARPFIFSTAPAPPLLGAALRALEIVRSEPGIRSRLLSTAAWFRQRLRQDLGVSTPSRSHIVPVILGENALALEAADRLRAAGFHVKAIRPPTVPRGEARLRISLTTASTREQLARLLRVLQGVIGSC